MSNSGYEGSLEGVRAMLSSEMIGDMLLQRATQIMLRARSIAPVSQDPNDPHPGRYRDSFHVKLEYDRSRYRLQAVVYNDSPEALFVEKGTVNNEAYHVLIRAATAAGIQ